jgi:hypothetical protein
MERVNFCLEVVQNKLKEGKGIQALRSLNIDEKKQVLEIEAKVEEKIAYGMCKTYNEGAREAIKRDYTIAMVMNTSIFEYPHHPLMRMVSDNTIVGEQVSDPSIIAELKINRTNFFLWENFVIYTSRLPKEREVRQKVRLVYLKRGVPQLEGIPYVEGGIFGTLSSEGDALVKGILSFSSSNQLMGTSLIGFNIKEDSE